METFRFIAVSALLAQTVVLGSIIRSHVSTSEFPEMKYLINKTWDGDDLLDRDKIHVTFQLIEGLPAYNGKRGLHIKFDGPFYNDPKISDTVPIDEPFFGLWEYEVVEFFFLGEGEKYLEVELGPKGHHVIFLMKGTDRLIDNHFDLKNYTAVCSTTSGRWLGEAFIPGDYFPCGVKRFNAFGIHGSGEGRTHSALYPVEKGVYSLPDFHRLEAFQGIEFGKELNPACEGGLGQGSILKGLDEVSHSNKLPEVVDA